MTDRPGMVWPKRLLLAAACLSLLVFAYDLTNLAHHAATSRAIVLYFGLPLTAAAALAACARWLRADLQLTLVNTLAAVLVATYAAEFTIGFATDHRPVLPAAPRDGLDKRTKLQVVADLKAKGQPAWPYASTDYVKLGTADGNASPMLTADGHELWPTGFISDSVAVVCREGRDWLAHPTDRHGFHNPSLAWDQPISVVGVGDSYTHGECVRFEDSFMGLIRAEVPGTLSLGVSSSGPLVHLANLVEYGRRLKPAVALWFFFEGNDMDDLAYETRNGLLPRYLDPAFRQDLPAQQDRIDAEWRRVLTERMARAGEEEAARRRGEWISALKLQSIRLMLGLVHVEGVAPPAALYDRLEQALTRARDEAAGWGGRLEMVYLPSPYRYHPKLRLGMEDTVHAKVTAIAERLGIPVTDMVTVFAATGQDPLMFYQGHFTEAGNKLVADAVLPRVRATLAAPARQGTPH
jgi:hypothetical protein